MHSGDGLLPALGNPRLEILVKVVPRASKSEVVGLMDDGALKVNVAAVPEKGRDNDELRETLARHFEVPVRNVEVIAGLTSTRKRVRISGLS